MTEQESEKAHIRLLEQMLSACHTASNERREQLLEAKERIEELTAHMRRWATSPAYQHEPPIVHGETRSGTGSICWHCGMNWPCATVVLVQIFNGGESV